jgi:hypothetical protein
VNRWRQRLAELHGDSGYRSSALSTAVQNVQNVQNAESRPSFEHFGQFEHSAGPPAISAPPSVIDHALASWTEAENERAAIVEHEGEILREWAEGFARLDPDRAPAGMPLKRWRRFVDDVGLFLDRWAAHAAALGWGPHDLFGADRERPFSHIDSAGLLWHINGDKLVALSKNAAGIATRTGARQTYCRKPNAPGRVLAWELM